MPTQEGGGGGFELVTFFIRHGLSRLNYLLRTFMRDIDTIGSFGRTLIILHFGWHTKIYIYMCFAHV
jgi:hypothetical protein